MPVTLSLNPWIDITQLLDYPFMQNALAAGTIVALLGGVVGYFMVLRGQSFAGHTLSQMGFPGAAGAALIGAPPLLGLLLCCTVGAIAIHSVDDARAPGRRLETAAIGAILALALAAGFLFVRLNSRFADTALTFLFGTILGITDAQVAVLAVIAVVIAVVLAVIGRPLLFASIDADVAAARGVPVRGLSAVFLLALGLTVAACSLITGALLVFALLVAPAAAAQRLTARPLWGVVVSVVIAVVVTWGGMAMAYYSVYPAGFFVTTLAFAVYVAARVYDASMRGAFSLTPQRVAHS